MKKKIKFHDQYFSIEEIYKFEKYINYLLDNLMYIELVKSIGFVYSRIYDLDSYMEIYKTLENSLPREIKRKLSLLRDLAFYSRKYYDMQNYMLNIINDELESDYETFETVYIYLNEMMNTEEIFQYFIGFTKSYKIQETKRIIKSLSVHNKSFSRKARIKYHTH